MIIDKEISFLKKLGFYQKVPDNKRGSKTYDKPLYITEGALVLFGLDNKRYVRCGTIVTNKIDKSCKIGYYTFIVIGGKSRPIYVDKFRVYNEYTNIIYVKKVKRTKYACSEKHRLLLGKQSSYYGS